jgi:hypothetical protein
MWGIWRTRANKRTSPTVAGSALYASKAAVDRLRLLNAARCSSSSLARRSAGCVKGFGRLRTKASNSRLSPEFRPERRLMGRLRSQWVGRQTAKSAIKQLFELLLTKRSLVVAV